MAWSILARDVEFTLQGILSGRFWSSDNRETCRLGEELSNVDLVIQNLDAGRGYSNSSSINVAM
jgi:hypothetical protein